jgi:hypothetical protein
MSYKKTENCKHCLLSFTNLNRSERANHSRWCLQNPKRADYCKKNNGSQLRTPEAIAKRSAKIKQAHIDGKYIGSQIKGLETKKNNGSLYHTEETKKLLRDIALSSTHRRLVRSIREYTCIDGSKVMLDSSWEEVLAKRLDELNIKWIRPNPLPWTDSNGLVHNYFPDFYLPEYDLYLDPKNPHAVNVQKKKLDILSKQYNNVVIIETLNGCKNFSVKEYVCRK